MYKLCHLYHTYTNVPFFFFLSVGSGSISTVLPSTDYYNNYAQYSSPYGGYSYGGSSGGLLSK